jgi:FkbM family methyltransferase
VKLLDTARAIRRTAQYNRDWPRYVWTALAPPRNDTLLSFRLRNGQTIVTHGSTRWVLNEIYAHRVYDVPGADFASCRHIFDIGANVGVFALYVSAMAPKATVHCFEPSSTNFPLLEKNLTVNRAKARPYRLAVSSVSGPRPLSLKGSAIEYSLSATGDSFEVVDCVDLATVFEMSGVQVCDFMKLDVEGEELAILTTAPTEVLQRIRAFAIEWHHSAEQLEVVRARLDRAGFETFIHMEGRETMLKGRRC